MTREKTIFLIRFIAFVIFACALPFAFIAWRFGLFSQSQGSGVALSGWGVVAIIVVLIFAIYVLRMLKLGQPFSLFSQIVSGLVKVILPLVICLLVLRAMKNNIDAMIQALTCTIICEMVAIVVNPLPKWVEDNHIERESLKVSALFNKFTEWWKGVEEK